MRRLNKRETIWLIFSLIVIALSDVFIFLNWFFKDEQIRIYTESLVASYIGVVVGFFIAMIILSKVKEFRETILFTIIASLAIGATVFVIQISIAIQWIPGGVLIPYFALFTIYIPITLPVYSIIALLSFYFPKRYMVIVLIAIAIIAPISIMFLLSPNLSKVHEEAGYIKEIKISPDGAKLSVVFLSPPQSVKEGSILQIWDVKSGNLLKELYVPSFIYKVSPFGRFYALSEEIYSSTNGEKVYNISHAKTWEAWDWSRYGDFLVEITKNNTVVFVETENFSVTKEVAFPSNMEGRFWFSPGANLIVVINKSNITLINVSDSVHILWSKPFNAGKFIEPCLKYLTEPFRICFSNDETYLQIVTFDHNYYNVTIFDVKTGKETESISLKADFLGHNTNLLCSSFGKLYFISSHKHSYYPFLEIQDYMIHVYNISGEMKSLSVGGYAWTASTTPDGKIIALGYQDGIAEILDTTQKISILKVEAPKFKVKIMPDIPISLTLLILLVISILKRKLRKETK